MQIKFEWTSEISVGDEIIDNQHKKLLEKINELLEAILDRRDDNIIEGVIAFLGDYIEEHLLYEEKYMKRHLYPDLREHREIHNRFIERYADFKEKLKKDGYSGKMSNEVEIFLGDWWLKHIGVEDKKYFLFIKENEK